MRIVFLGTPDAAVASLDALVAAGHDVVLVVSRPDRRRGRGSALVASPVKAAALRHGLSVTDRVADVHAAIDAGAELAVIVAFGQLIRRDLLDRVPFLNLHFSLLPRWRGAAPVERAILAGDTETGVCLMGLEEGLDTGPVYRRLRTPIADRETAPALLERLGVDGAAMLVDALRDGWAGLGTPEPQHGEVTHAEKITAADLRIDWHADATRVARTVRLGEAWTALDGRRVRVLAGHAVADVSGAVDGTGAPGRVTVVGAVPVVATGGGGYAVERVQPEGKPAMDASAWVRGARLGSDATFE